MFGFFASQQKKMCDNAANWLELASKVYHFRRDVIPASPFHRQAADRSRHCHGAKPSCREAIP